jgi:hypothetical protein
MTHRSTPSQSSSHCEKRSDEAIQPSLAVDWIASSLTLLAMTDETYTAAAITSISTL